MAVWAVVASAVVTLAPLLWLRPAAGTPGLPAHVEALRSEARTYEMARPVHAEGWTLVLTAASSRKVWVSFMRDGAGTGETGIDVGSSAQAADCTIAALGSHPARWGDAPGVRIGAARRAVLGWRAVTVGQGAGRIEAVRRLLAYEDADRSRAGTGPISSRKWTDLGAEPDRSRRGSGPISSRK